MQRFFSSLPLSDHLIWTDAHRVHQITRVLRLKEGYKVVCFDGDGTESVYILTHIDRGAVHLEREEQYIPPDREPTIHITLYQALPNRHEKIEWIIQKAVEVGIRRIVLFRAERSQKLIISPAKMARYRAIAEEACEQCGWLIPIEIEISEDTPVGSEHQHIVLHPLGTPVTWKYFGDIATDTWGIWAWPEWGWSEEEISKMNNYWYIIARFSERILRTETAGIVAAFGILHTKHYI